MSISSVQTSQNVYTDYFIQKTSSQSNKAPSSNNSESYTLHISDEANKLSKERQVENNANAGQSEDSARMSQADLPLEAFALPMWSNKWIPDLVVYNSKIGEKYTDSNSYKYNSLNSNRKAELNEYTDTVLKYINEELKNNGINDRVDYYTKFMQDDELSKQVKQAVTDRLADNPRIMELMESFGISLF